MIWCSHLFQNFPQFIVIHTVKGFGIVNKAEIRKPLRLLKNLLELVNKVSKFTEQKAYTQKSVAFYTPLMTIREIKKAILLIIASKRINM